MIMEHRFTYPKVTELSSVKQAQLRPDPAWTGRLDLAAAALHRPAPTESPAHPAQRR
jgi:hypothetical protein